MSEKFANLPNSKGHYVKTRVPQYVLNILENVRPAMPYEIGRWGLDVFVLQGVNPIRPDYGVPDDLDKLEKWVMRYHADFKTIYINRARKHYYGAFVLTDPVQLQLQKAGLLS